MSEDERKPVDTNNNTAIALALGEMRGEMRADMRVLRSTVDALSAQSVRNEAAVYELGNKMVDFHTRVTAMEGTGLRPRQYSLTGETVGNIIQRENEKQSESIKAAAITVAQPVAAATAAMADAQTALADAQKRQPYWTALAVAVASGIATLITALAQSCGHH